MNWCRRPRELDFKLTPKLIAVRSVGQSEVLLTRKEKFCRVESAYFRITQGRASRAGAWTNEGDDNFVVVGASEDDARLRSNEIFVTVSDRTAVGRLRLDLLWKDRTLDEIFPLPTLNCMGEGAGTCSTQILPILT